jgi:hypothetical protein
MASVPRLRRWGWGWAQGEIHAARGIRVYCALQVQGAQLDRVFTAIGGLVVQLAAGDPAIRDGVDAAVIQIEHDKKFLRGKLVALDGGRRGRILPDVYDIFGGRLRVGLCGAWRVGSRGIRAGVCGAAGAVGGVGTVGAVETFIRVIAVGVAHAACIAAGKRGGIAAGIDAEARTETVAKKRIAETEKPEAWEKRPEGKYGLRGAGDIRPMRQLSSHRKIWHVSRWRRRPLK